MSEVLIDNKNSLKATRESGIELFRIITMLLIIAHHYVVNSTVMDIARENPLSMPSVF